jgi:hypothetical protein
MVYGYWGAACGPGALGKRAADAHWGHHPSPWYVRNSGLAERILIVRPADPAFQWQHELTGKFDAKFLVMKGQGIGEQFGGHR